MVTISSGRMKLLAASTCAAAIIAAPAVAGATLSPRGQATVQISAAADTSPSCPGADLCLQPGTDPGVPYGTDPFVPYGTDVQNSSAPFGRGSGSYTGGAF